MTNNTPAPADRLSCEAAFLLALAEHGVASAVGEILIQGDGRHCGPGALAKAIAAYDRARHSFVAADLVEAVAKACYEAGSSGTKHGTSYENLPEAVKTYWRTFAQAAITAMQAYTASDGVTQMDRDAAMALAKQVASGQVDRIPDYDPFVQAFAAHRRAAAITPQPDWYDAEIERQENLAKTYRQAQLLAEEKLKREQDNAKGWQRRAEYLEGKLKGLNQPDPRDAEMPADDIAIGDFIAAYEEGSQGVVMDCDDAKALALKFKEMASLIYVPGVWRCAKCDFSLTQSNLNMANGTVTARDETGTKCPNDGAPMWRVSYRDWARDMDKSLDVLADRKNAEIERLRETLAKAEADAARYRWLRDDSCPPHNFYVSVPDEFHGVTYSPQEVDAYIDEARAALAKSEGQ